MATKSTGTSGSKKRAAAAKKKKTVADKHVGRRGGTKTRAVNAPRPW